MRPLSNQLLNKAEIMISGLSNGASGQTQAALPQGLEIDLPVQTSGLWDYGYPRTPNHELGLADVEGRSDVVIDTCLLDVHTGRWGTKLTDYYPSYCGASSVLLNIHLDIALLCFPRWTLCSFSLQSSFPHLICRLSACGWGSIAD